MQNVKKTIPLILFSLLLLNACSTVAHEGWDFLGSRTVNDRTESDTISVGIDEGRFNRLRLNVEGAPVEVKRVVVTFGNGERQTIEKNQIIRAQGTGPVLNLDGSNRIVQSVRFVYETRSPGYRRAEVRLYGS